MSLPEPLLPFVAIIFIFFSLAIVAISIVVFYNVFTRWLGIIQKEESHKADEVINDAYTQAFQIIENARKEAVETIEAANSKAQKSLLDTKKFTVTEANEWNSTLESSLQSFQDSLDVATKDMMNYYQDIISEHKSKNLVTLQKLTQHLESELLNETKQYESYLQNEATSFGQTMKERTINKEDEISEKLETTYQQVAHEIDAYKKRRLKEINLSIIDILQNVTEDMLGRSLNLEDHEELIYQSLQEAIKHNELPTSHAE